MRLRQQIAIQQQNNANIQNVLVGLSAVRQLLDTAQGNIDPSRPQPVGANIPAFNQIQAALQAESFLQAAQSQIQQMMAQQQLIATENQSIRNLGFLASS